MSTFIQQQPNRVLPAARRIAAFDVAKGVAVVLMIMIHVLDFYGLPEVRFGVFGSTLKFAVGWPAASMFVFVMGLFVTYTGNHSLRQDLMRAAGLFALGYLLNLTRSTIPMWLSIEIGLVTAADVAPHTPLSEFLIVDVFQFAGLALLICALLKHYLPHPGYWLLAALAVAFVSPLLWDISSNNVVLNEVLKLLVGNEAQGAMFPLFPWLAYPLAGMALGYGLRRTGDIDKGLQGYMWLGWVLMAGAAVLMYSNTGYHIADNLRSGPGLIVFFSGLILVFLWGCHTLTKHASKHNSVLSLIRFWGERVTAMYVVQWLLIGWGLMLFGLQQMNLIQNVLAMVGVLLLSDMLVRAWCSLRKVRRISAGASVS
ncbi:heparan-alpha-glucosaminide N-acetyltransferase domain-containing protein [Planctobacterium marinum]|uniref:heparan-alpha-glucosaminide N-acetyltransferase domain-containing protein n=1 Tax=Planctobacterium marinum TaxID=1631968 RepID=UPI001E48A07F|nr:heparan-alpha-glucosaminide N-acetyltransferase domain-containing protein [Planctobacterium marinum]MCC2606946.1 DUF1624 domain-containing protein [Planctobacterium marinum]